jgi:branched-chain amino acid transport system substrate-binding protein
VDNAIDGLKALAAGQEIAYAGASGPCRFSDIGNIMEVTFRFNQVKGGRVVEVKV